MKQLVAGAVILSSLMMGNITIGHAMAETKCVQPSPIKVDLPDLKNAAVVKSLKNGSYQYKGIKSGDKFSEVEKKMGLSEKEMTQELGFGIISSNHYGPLTIVTIDKDRHIEKAKRTVVDFRFDVPKNQKIHKSDIKGLGKPDTYENWSKSKRYEQYGSLALEMNKSGKDYLITSISIEDGKLSDNYNQDPKKQTEKINTEPLKPMTAAQLKAMQKGTFSYYDVKRNMTPAQVYKKVGDALSNEYLRQGTNESLIQSYNDFYGVEFDYYGSCKNPLHIKEMKFDYTMFNSSVAKLEETVGKPDSKKVKTTSFDGEKISELTARYGHLYVHAEKDATQKQYRITQLRYK